MDGLELTFALNHLAYFLLTNLLLDLLRAGVPARVVNVTSSAQALGDIHFDDLQFERRYRGQAAYNQSKLANVLFTYELARRLDGAGVTVNCPAPGVTRTNFGREDSGPVMRLLRPWGGRSCARPRRAPPPPCGWPPPRGRGRDRPVLPAPPGQADPAAVLQAFLRPRAGPATWQVSEELTGLRQPA